MKITTHALFPSLVVRTECDDFNSIKKELIDWVYSHQEKTESVNKSNQGGWQSPDLDLEDKTFKKFVQYIKSHIDTSLFYHKVSYEFDNAWININKKGDSNSFHAHPGADLSGVLWIKTPDDCGNLSFLSPNNYTEYKIISVVSEEIKEQTNYYDAYQFEAMEGCMILFPSHLYHSVEVSQSNEDRISIAFNLLAKI